MKKKVTYNQLGRILYWFATSNEEKDWKDSYSRFKEYYKIEFNNFIDEIMLLRFFAISVFVASKFSEEKKKNFLSGFLDGLNFCLKDNGADEAAISQIKQSLKERNKEYSNILFHPEADSTAPFKLGAAVVKNICGREIKDPILVMKIVAEFNLFCEHGEKLIGQYQITN